MSSAPGILEATFGRAPRTLAFEFEHSGPGTRHRPAPPVVRSMQRPTQRRRTAAYRRPIARSGFRSYGRRNWTAARRGTGRGAQGFLRRRTRIGQKTFSRRTNLPEIKRKELPSLERTYKTNIVGAGPDHLPIKGEIFVPAQYQEWFQGLGMDKITGTQVMLKNITGRLKISFEDNGVNNASWNFRLVTGFCKMGDFHPLADTSAIAGNPFPEGIVLNYGADTITTHVSNVLSDSVGNLSGVLHQTGGVDTRQLLVTGDERITSPWRTQTTVAGGAAVARPDIVRTFNWNCNKRMKLYQVTSEASAAAANVSGIHHYEPVNDPRPLIPFITLMCTNPEEHPEAQEFMPKMTFDSCSYWNDC